MRPQVAFDSAHMVVQQQLTNHIAMMIDGSGSMSGIRDSVVKVVDAQIAKLQQRSVELNQETRISIYIFDDKVQCVVFDMDVMRFKSLKGYYKIGGMTALVDAMLLGIRDHTHLPQIYGDHAFLMYAITDGGNNVNSTGATQLKNTIATLAENWTVACLVPDATCSFEAKKFGFPEGAISLWNASSAAGFEEVGANFDNAMVNYMQMRATGVRGAKAGLFTLKAEAIKKADLKPISASQYDVFPVRDNNKYAQIREFVEKWSKEPYRLGSAYYELAKPVEIQRQKNILVMDKKNSRVYEGSNLRQVLGLPDHTVKVNPVDHKNFTIFVQSTSVNRKPIPGTLILVRK